MSEKLNDIRIKSTFQEQSEVNDAVLFLIRNRLSFIIYLGKKTLCQSIILIVLEIMCKKSF
jgi:hypothetical protein